MGDGVRVQLALSLCMLGVWSGIAQAQVVQGVDLSEPLTAQGLVQVALDRNLALLQAEQNVYVSEGNYKQARSALLPSLSAGLDFDRTFNEAGQRINPLTNEIITSSSATTAYSVGASGRLNLVDVPSWYSFRGAGRDLMASEASFVATQLDIVQSVQEAYYALVRAQELARVSQEDVELREEQLARSEALYNLGSVARSDVLQAQVNLATSRREFIAAENDIAKQRANLCLMVGIPVNSPLQVAPPARPEERVPDAGEEALTQEALRNRPDLAQSRLDLESAFLDETATKWERWPSLGMSYSYRSNDRELDQLLSNALDEFTVNFSVGVNWTVFDGLSTKGAIERSIANRRAQERALTEHELQVALDVRNAVLDIQTAQEQIRSAQEGVRFAEESVKLQQALYESGGGTLLEWNNAQVELTRARVSLVDAEIDLHLALVLLQRALGAAP